MNDNKIKLTEKQKAVVDSLLVINDDQVISLIQDFRDNGEIFIVHPLIEMLYSNRGDALKKSILEFISDIRNQAAARTIAQSIQRHIDDTNTTGLISACWQSNLDFSNELPIFIDILCNNDYQTSLEAFTVIENSAGNVDQKKIDLYIATIESKLKATPVEKQSLLTEMIITLETIKRSGQEE